MLITHIGDSVKFSLFLYFLEQSKILLFSFLKVFLYIDEICWISFDIIGLLEF